MTTLDKPTSVHCKWSPYFNDAAACMYILQVRVYRGFLLLQRTTVMDNIRAAAHQCLHLNLHTLTSSFLRRPVRRIQNLQNGAYEQTAHLMRSRLRFSKLSNFLVARLVSKNVLSPAPPCFESTLSRWSRLHLQPLALANPYWTCVVPTMAQSPYPIHREGLCPSSGAQSALIG
ncbi:hypothetical protein evm_014312 [Chilo suppressalis]|nr:hypothetical protein evm_014312 [Chilo suppressalis]